MGAFAGMWGVALLPLTLGLEEGVGLDGLFRLRGPREVPPAVTVVTLDRVSAEELQVPTDPDEWPRSMHARLIESLARRGAAVIAFDMIFESPGGAEDDAKFAAAMAKAGNVVLGQGLTRSTHSLDGPEGLPLGSLSIEKLVSPAAPLAGSALALAPFPLPKIPVQVSQYWRIKPEAGDVATLPVVVFQVWALQAWEDFVALLHSAGLDPGGTLPGDGSAVFAQKDIQGLIQALRELFAQHPSAAPRLPALLEASIEGGPDSGKARILRSLVRLHSGPRSCHLNFYGPPGTVETLRYSDLVDSPGRRAGDPPLPDLRGRAVFVGLSERMRPDQKDGFHTVFSLPNGVDLSGVEIAATAFANLVEDNPVQPLDPGLHLCFIGAWGVLLGVACRLLPPAFSAAGVVTLGALYVAFAYHRFHVDALWLPLVLPLVFQLPVAFFGALLWQYVDANRERRNIRKAAGYYLPDHVVEGLARSAAGLQAEGQSVYGTCLMTDAEQYTRLSEQLTPEDLSRFMNAYYAVIFEPVREQGGVVSDVVGDCMLALWAAANPEAEMKTKACRAALEIVRAVEGFNRASEFLQLPTRVGLHAGEMMLGNIGAGDHFEYRPVGEVVNTASRIEGLNKYLRTRVLVSGEVVAQTHGFLLRDLGDFVFAGKSTPVRIYELIGGQGDADPALEACCAVFARALEEFRARHWRKAARLLESARELRPDDGPCAFFMDLCAQYDLRPPGEGWDGSVRVDRK